MINVIEHQESSPFTSVGKSFEKNCILPCYYVYSFVLTIRARFVKSMTFPTFNKSSYNQYVTCILILFRAHKRRYEVGGCIT